ncbi:hypothetical protein [Sulfurimonas marina]|uniref:PilZ domain-containing protein n=1 Tax=Sulfurimonas marina TaxID=2590551 RepID=A0A7M1AWA4_9BACT|nr:hypothetical protein [Sulfurimonas marina]QOP41705.1 hypothetical protein FJR03_08135 [Sulfurimonas marina]
MLKLCYIYNEDISSKHYNSLSENFEIISVDLDTTEEIPSTELYILDLKHITKELSLLLKNSLDKELHKLIYFNVPQKYTLLHFQLALLLQCKSIITEKQDTQKIVHRVKDEYYEHIAKQHNQPQEECDQTLETRLGFIELLKDKFLSKTKQLGLITIALKTIDETQLKVVINEINTVLNTSIQLAQYNGHFYLALHEGLEFDNLQQKAKELNIHLNELASLHNIVLSHEVYAIDLDGMEFDSILEMLIDLEKNKLSNDLKLNSQVCFIENMAEHQSDEYILRQMLNAMKFNKVDIKLLNIYKGLVINSKASVVKVDDRFIQLELQKLQIEATSIQKMTTIEIPGYSQTIEASLKHISFQKGVATFEHFTLMKTGVNARKHGRVTCERTTNINISAEGTSLKGVILDLSLVSVAIKLPYTKTLDRLYEKDVVLTFELSLQKNKIVNTIVRKASVQRIFVDEQQKAAKLICDFHEDHNNEHLISEYIFQRQKSIVKEIKMLSLKA